MPQPADPPSDSSDVPVRVRAINGQVGDDAWIRHRLIPLRQRAVEAGKFFGIGLAGGAVFLVVPLIHLLGILFALVMLGIAIARVRATAVVDAAGGICPRCKHDGRFFVGLGHRRFRLPMDASCEQCGTELTLHPLSA